MAIITVSRGSYSKGKEIAEKVAQELGYECISRDILLQASAHFNVPEIKLIRALHDAPSILGRLSYGKEGYIAYIEEALLEHVRKDNVVYHGLAGHFFLQGVSHVLKVRIIADLEDRARLESEREQIPKDKALYLLEKDDEERRRWSQALYGVDTFDPSLYDLVIHISHVTVETAVNIICNAAQAPEFETTPQSQQLVDDLTLAAHVKAHLVREWPKVRVTASAGQVLVETEAARAKEAEVAAGINEAVRGVDGVKDLKVTVRPITRFG